MLCAKQTYAKMYCHNYMPNKLLWVRNSPPVDQRLSHPSGQNPTISIWCLPFSERMKEGTVTQLCQQTNCRTTNLISLHIVLQVVGNWRRWCNGAKQSPTLIWIRVNLICQRKHTYICTWSEVQTNSHKYLWIFGRSTLNIATARAEQIRYLLLAETLMDLWSICGDFIWSSRVQTESPLWSKTPPRSKIPTCWVWNLKKMEFQRIWKRWVIWI